MNPDSPRNGLSVSGGAKDFERHGEAPIFRDVANTNRRGGGYDLKWVLMLFVVKKLRNFLCQKKANNVTPSIMIVVPSIDFQCGTLGKTQIKYPEILY